MFAGGVFNFGRQKEFGEQLLEREIEELKKQLAFGISEEVFKKEISDLQRYLDC